MADPTFLQALSLHDFEPLARAVMEPATFDYVAGGAWDEVTLGENEAAWRRRRLRPRVLVDVSAIDPSTTMLGSAASMPVAIAPMATQRLAHAEAEAATARAAAAAGVPFTLSTMSSDSIEEVAAATPGGTTWFQLYAQAAPGRTRELVERAATSGYRALLVTVDLPVLGYRERDRRSGFELTGLGNFRRAAAGPTHAGGVHAGAIDADADADVDGFALLDEQADVGWTWSQLEEIRSWSEMPLVLKGVMTAEDARLAVEHGAEAVVVSNHGGRQLDRVHATIDVLEEIVAAVDGRTEVWVDGGVRRGLDVAIALALGARGVLVGKPIYWALAAGGQSGVERALSILREEFEIALALLGAPTPADVTRAHVSG